MTYLHEAEKSFSIHDLSYIPTKLLDEKLKYLFEKGWIFQYPPQRKKLFNGKLLDPESYHTKPYSIKKAYKMQQKRIGFTHPLFLSQTFRDVTYHGLSCKSCTSYYIINFKAYCASGFKEHNHFNNSARNCPYHSEYYV